MYQRILVPVDGSPASMRGLDEAIRIALSSGGKLMLVHVANEAFYPAAGVSGEFYEELLESMRITGSHILAQAQAQARKAGVQFESDLIESIGGSVSTLVLEAARNWQADLIVMGTHGRRGVRRLVLGSDAELVLRRATVPVLMVREKPEED